MGSPPVVNAFRHPVICPRLLLCLVHSQLDPLNAVILDDEGAVLQGDLCCGRQGPGPAACRIELNVDDGKVVPRLCLGARQTCAEKQQRLVGEDRQKPAIARDPLDREARRRVAFCAPIFTVPVGLPFASALRRPAAPPVLNAATAESASVWDIFRSIFIVIGALAAAPAADLTVAVALMISAAPCARAAAGIVNKAPESNVAPMVLYLAVIPHLSRTRLEC